MTKVAVFSAGSWGTAFSMVLADAGNDVVLWARREELRAEAINETHQNPDYQPGIQLPPAVSATHDVLEKALLGAESSPRHAVADVARQPRRVGVRTSRRTQ